MALLSAAAPITGARLGVAPTTWPDAVAAACAPLVESGAVEPRYPDRCVAMVHEHGPYIVLAPGIALAHARPEDGVLRLGLAVATLAAPLAFGHPENDPVDVVFAFGSPDTEQHVGLLGALARRLSAGLADELRADEDIATAEGRLREVARDVR